jgi:F-type H+-transporting ATPase subunit b
MHNFFLLLQEPVANEAAPKVNLLSPNGGLMFWTLIVFLILFFVLGKFVFPKITASVEAREKALEDAVAGAKRDREEAAKYLAEQRAAIEKARDEAGRILAEGRSMGEKLRGEMLEHSRVEQQDMLDRARREIDAERYRAIAELRREAVDLAIAGASRVIEKNLDQKSNRDIVEKFLSSIPVAGAKPGSPAAVPHAKPEEDSSPYADA